MKKIFSIVSLVLIASMCMWAQSKAKLEVIVAGEAQERTMTYLQSTPLEMPNGKTILNGDFKPMWQEVQRILNIQIVDKTTASQKTNDMWAIASTNQFKDADVYGGPNLAEKIMNEGANNGSFVNLAKYMNQMPNFKKFLDQNPDAKKAITAYDGGIYSVPYMAEIGYYARVYVGRNSWVTVLLDGTLKDGSTPAALEKSDAANTLPVAYQGFWGTKRVKQNVVALQNAKAQGGKLSQADALDVLKTYIKTNYPNLKKASDLYLGSKANYDVDELVALWRVIKLSPATLSKVASGTAKPDAVIYPYFSRQPNYGAEILRLLNSFGGIRVNGSDSYQARWVFDEKGVLQYSYYQDDFLKGIDYLRQIFSEGLIDPKVGPSRENTNLRSRYYFSDGVATNKEYGFMTYDFISSTTATGAGTGLQTDAIAILPPVTTTPVSGGKYIHYMDNTRVIKGDGWGISSRANADAIKTALKMFDFFFSPQGNIMQNFAPDYLLTGNKWKRPDGTPTEYPEFQKWVLDSANKFKNGNISDFLRDYLGVVMPIGYVKSIGMEYQNTSVNGFKSWDIYNEAKVLTSSYSAKEAFYKLTPPAISVNKMENNLLNGIQFAASANDEEGGPQAVILSYVVNNSNSAPNTDAIKAKFKDMGIEQYINIYRNAFNRQSK